MHRQVVLDTETTGLEVSEGHRIIEIGCVELCNRRPTGRNFHHYVNPERAIDLGAQNVHGISEAVLATKPRFAELAQELWSYLRGAELIIHNAAFDLGFLNAEFRLAGIRERLEEVCTVIDTLALARRLHPGQKANLDALCRRYGIDHSRREIHGALLDAQLLAEVYLAMTGGQVGLELEREPAPIQLLKTTLPGEAPSAADGGDALPPLRVIRASAQELAAHRARLAAIAEKARTLLWPEERESSSPSNRRTLSYTALQSQGSQKQGATS